MSSNENIILQYSYWEHFKAAKELAAIEGVDKFECLRQTNANNQFKYGLSMEFKNAQLYNNYSNYPMHISFVQQVWIPEVEDFLEIAYELIQLTLLIFSNINAAFRHPKHSLTGLRS